MPTPEETEIRARATEYVDRQLEHMPPVTAYDRPGAIEKIIKVLAELDRGGYR